MTINGLEERILALSGVEKQKGENGACDSYLLGPVPFITEVHPTSLILHMTSPCLDKLSNALRTEPRVETISEKSATVKFHFKDDVDKEFVFLYIRFAWKYWRAASVAA